MYYALMYVYMNRSTCIDIVYTGGIWGNMKKCIILYFFKNIIFKGCSVSFVYLDATI